MKVLQNKKLELEEKENSLKQNKKDQQKEWLAKQQEKENYKKEREKKLESLNRKETGLFGKLGLVLDRFKEIDHTYESGSSSKSSLHSGFTSIESIESNKK